jgi:hypothetical protein
MEDLTIPKIITFGTIILTISLAIVGVIDQINQTKFERCLDQQTDMKNGEQLKYCSEKFGDQNECKD